MIQIRPSRPITFAAMITTLALFHSCPAPALADPLPLEVAWAELDGPKPRGPGTILVDHQPANFGGLASDTLFTDFPGGYQRVADDFTVAQAAVVNRIVWWGFYDQNVMPSVDDMFRIRLYDQQPTAALPGNVLYEQSFSSVPRTWTGRFIVTFGAPRELRYEVGLSVPMTLNPLTPYWLEIVQDGDVNSHFRWEQSQNTLLNGQAFVNAVVGDWTQSFPSPQSNTAFQLITVPEPTSAILFAFLIALGMRRPGKSLT